MQPKGAPVSTKKPHDSESATAPSMARGPRLDPIGESSLFREAVADARPLTQDRRPAHRRKPKPIAHQRRRDEQAVLQSLLSDDYDPAEIETSEELAYARPGLQSTVWRKFRRGQYAIEAELDLHGCKVPEARELVHRFLRRCQADGKRCVRIIHGKGKSAEGKLPVLKGKVNGWLRQKDEVLAFSSARPQHGGTGAVYVLLRRKA
jgi:DNA-nicking Smr family endonuclease